MAVATGKTTNVANLTEVLYKTLNFSGCSPNVNLEKAGKTTVVMGKVKKAISERNLLAISKFPMVTISENQERRRPL